MGASRKFVYYNSYEKKQANLIQTLFYGTFENSFRMEGFLAKHRIHLIIEFNVFCCLLNCANLYHQ